MLINLFHTVRASGVPCTLRELLDLLGALEKKLDKQRRRCALYQDYLRTPLDGTLGGDFI